MNHDPQHDPQHGQPHPAPTPHAASSDAAPPPVEPQADTLPPAAEAPLASTDPHTELEQLRGELTLAQARSAELADQVLRAQAEVQNARRRADDEVAKIRKFAIEGFAESLLPVIDSLEAGLKVDSATAEQLREGTEATLRQLMAALERNKVIEVNPAPGARFDPANQQAISLVPADQEANTVVSVLQKGYTIAERVLRPALVTVAAPK